MSWYNVSGPESDVVVSTRCRFARNCKDHKFPSKMSLEESEKLISEISDGFLKTESDFRLIKTRELKSSELLTLFEKHLISLDLVKNPERGALLLRDDEEVSIMLCEEDHIRLQAILPGFQPEEAYALAEKYEKILSMIIPFAENEQFGFLSACPANAGPGMRISAMLHLPALAMTKKIGETLNSLGKLGLTMRGMYGEGTGAGCALYQISNQVALGISCQEILRRVSGIIRRTADAEMKTREAILKNNTAEISNRCLRSLAILKNSYSLSFTELLAFLSDVRMGASLGIVGVPYEKISNLLVSGAPACIISSAGITDAAKRDVYRAEMAKKLL